MSILFEQKYKIFLIYFSGKKWQNCAVHICTVLDTLHALQRSAAVPICPAWSALHLARPALLSVLCSHFGCAGRCREPPAGYIAAAQPRPVSSAKNLQNKKGVFPRLPTLSFLHKTPPPLSQVPKISRKNKKTPTKGLRSVLYLPYKP